ncbi:MAG: HDIG domain-containing protein [bacterium]|nr:HDIG domain-containing protein [bacterium]MDT8396569.1 HDIG domain-containing protein [bacterium]
MDRQEAFDLVMEKVTEPSLQNHMLATEAVMRALAGRFGENIDKWGLAGLLHDLDYHETIDNFPRHGYIASEILREKGIDEEILDAIVAHAGHRERVTLLDKALYAADPVTGLIVAAALIRPEKKLEPVKLKSVRKRFKEKQFARGADRDQIRSCEEMGVPLDEFLELSLDAMKGIAEEIGL